MIKKILNHKTVLFLSILFFSTFSSVGAISGSLILEPNNPGPYEDTTITYKTFSFDVDNALLTWSVNNKIVLSGKGEKVLKIKTGNTGITLAISVKVKTPSGEESTTVLNLSPQAVDLTWETTESYTPPFYEGRSLPGENAEVRVIASPIFSNNGKLIPVTELSYAWYVNDTFRGVSSGRGKNVMKMRLDYLSNENVIKVIVRSENGGIAEKRTTIYPNDIIPVFYLKDPIYGLDLAHAIRKRFETTKEFTLALAPYFLSTKNNLAPEINYNWSLDGLPLTPAEDTVVSFSPKKDVYGAKTLSVSIKNAKRMLQSAEENLEIIFDTR